MTATVGTARRSSRSTTACASVSRASTAAASVMPLNSPMSAPAMKPPGLAERSTSPFGGSLSSLASTSLSSVSTSSESVLALAPALSSRSQAMPSSSRASRQCRHGPCPADPAGPSSRLRGARTSQTLPITAPLHRLDQHRAALPAADALGGDALPDAEPFHRAHEMQHDAVAAGAHGMAETYCPSIHIQLVARDAAHRAVEAEHLAAEGVVVPGGEAGQHLRRERLVQFPQPDVAEREPMPLHDRGRAQHRPEPHDRGIERRPFAVHDHRARREATLFHRLLGGQDHPGRAVRDLRAVAGGHLAPGPLERWLELGELLDRAVRPHAVVVVVDLAVA